MDAEVRDLAKVETHARKSSCTSCIQREICIPAGVTDRLFNDFDELIHFRIQLKSGATLFHSGGLFKGLYAVRSGFFKLENFLENGKIQINGFNMMGEIFGFDGIATGIHTCNSVALEDSEVCIIPFSQIEHIGAEGELLRHHLYKLMSREIIRNHNVMLSLGNMPGEERLATFLINLSQRLCERGYSPVNLVLRMTREDIGNHLGMTVESVSRIFSKFQGQGLLEVRLKNIRILDIQGLRELTGAC